ncbi:MAG: NAD(P)H-dependent glycerol-3-phosphate dehydrogenase [Candidatus Krumholzibacteria bacterium]|jgi:glycerol-3-phosphate dehydrogenase (NAD(P)+)|nr:NAD(P)H-dependent glycerol-3-phosphate dehydrogenase [Candidatus Krumholzibacteria bacterium]MDP6669553.1 NAD(P)H-dependent glycerol-3-phosphate dehydrogenase [Candidatus Krumholzibacteria bacterium]MDP6797773.1 NAD(P)H-dependent glycerol-3-phosphate dehydrogenase [Candidatus Krumholzibacteria bacterium]MDP7020889.1 NAD(P)H-dependent glycerol-3-phosphate dehydrogenase [Candidatus Krumholzibacteria bacterium]
MLKIAVIGCGSWGTALGKALLESGNEVFLWGHLEEEIHPIQKELENRKYLPGVSLPAKLQATTDLEKALENCDALLLVVPSPVIREVSLRISQCPTLPPKAAWILASKGLDPETGHPLSEAIANTASLSPEQIFALVGPSHAEEVAKQMPTALVLAGPDTPRRKQLQENISNDYLRVYVNDDLTGSQLGVAMKNVIALAAGICDGLGLGDNIKGALLSRGLAEMGRFIEAHGGRRETLLGLAGVGDLVTTCFSEHSRNRFVGQKIGEGKSLQEILAEMVQVSEGVHTTRTLHTLSLDRNVEMPITSKVYATLFEDLDAREAIRDLMTRDPAHEIRKGEVDVASS